MSTGKWLSARERKPLQQLQLAPLEFEQTKVRPSLSWKKGSPVPKPTKQATLDSFLAGSTMSRKSNQAKIKAPNVGYIRDDRHDSIETITSESSSSEECKREGRSETEGSSKKGNSKLELSPTRRSPQLHAQRSKVPKYSLPLVQSPPLPDRRSEILQTRPPPPTPSFNQPPAIDVHRGRSPSEPTPSYHTALTSSPVGGSIELSNSTKSTMGTSADESATSNNPVRSPREIPSSIPWENTPIDGYGDTWPSPFSDLSQTKSSQPNVIHRSQSHSNDGFRVPNSLSLRASLDETQDESQPYRGSLRPSQQSLGTRASQHIQDTVFRTPESCTWLTEGIDDTQDESQADVFKGTTQRHTHVQDLARSQETRPLENLKHLDIRRKRKREPTIDEIPDSDPDENPISEVQAQPPLEDSCIILSQPPPSMRKKTPEVINVHSTQSQSQEYVALPPRPGPRPTSQDLSNPFGRVDSEDSYGSCVHQSSHQWESSQVTQSPIDYDVDLGLLVNPPSQPLLSDENDLSRVPVPLRMTLEYGLPRRDFENMPDLDKMEVEQQLELQRWEAEMDTPKPRRK